LPPSRNSAVLARVISGGQTGADRAGLVAARQCGVETGGTAPRGFRTERGTEPELLRSFGLVEHASRHYPARTTANVENSDATLIIGARLDAGSSLTEATCRRLGRPVRVVAETSAAEVEAAASWLRGLAAAQGRALVLNVAGNRESHEPGLEARATEFMADLLRRLIPS